MADRITGTDQGRPDYGLDELVQTGVTVCIERMNNGHMWIGIYHPDGRTIRVGLHAKGTIRAYVEQEDDRPVPSPGPVHE